MCDDKDQTKPNSAEFDFFAFPRNTLFHERRTGQERRQLETPTPDANEGQPQAVPRQPRVKKDRRRRIDPTTFEKQYTPDELEFMNAMQRFKEHTRKSFPTHGEVLKVAVGLGYRLVVFDPEPPDWAEAGPPAGCSAETSSIDEA
jgi:hypothetical protein